MKDTAVVQNLAENILSVTPITQDEYERVLEFATKNGVGKLVTDKTTGKHQATYNIEGSTLTMKSGDDDNDNIDYHFIQAILRKYRELYPDHV